MSAVPTDLWFEEFRTQADKPPVRFALVEPAEAGVACHVSSDNRGEATLQNLTPSRTAAIATGYTQLHSTESSGQCYSAIATRSAHLTAPDLLSRTLSGSALEHIVEGQPLGTPCSFPYFWYWAPANQLSIDPVASGSRCRSFRALRRRNGLVASASAWRDLKAITDDLGHLAVRSPPRKSPWAPANLSRCGFRARRSECLSLPRDRERSARPAPRPARRAPRRARPGEPRCRARRRRANSTSPVCRPARTSMPSGLTASAIAAAHRMARAGPSNVARKPSPSDFTSCPRKRANSLRTALLWASRRSRQRFVANVFRPLRGTDDVGHQHRRQNAFDLDLGRRAGQEFHDMANDLAGIVAGVTEGGRRRSIRQTWRRGYSQP